MSCRADQPVCCCLPPNPAPHGGGGAAKPPPPPPELPPPVSLLVREPVSAVEHLLRRQPVVWHVASAATDQVIGHGGETSEPPEAETKKSARETPSRRVTLSFARARKKHTAGLPLPGDTRRRNREGERDGARAGRPPEEESSARAARTRGRPSPASLPYAKSALLRLFMKSGGGGGPSAMPRLNFRCKKSEVRHALSFAGGGGVERSRSTILAISVVLDTWHGKFRGIRIVSVRRCPVV